MHENYQPYHKVKIDETKNARTNHVGLLFGAGRELNAIGETVPALNKKKKRNSKKTQNASGESGHMNEQLECKT